MPRKTLDIDPEVGAMMARIEKLRTEHRLMLGDLVLETGAHKLLNADQIRHALLQACQQAGTPAREGKAAEAGAPFPAEPDAGREPAARRQPEPTRPRAADLLAGAAPK